MGSFFFHRRYKCLFKCFPAKHLQIILPFIVCICLCQAFQLKGSPLPAAAAFPMQHVYHIKEIQLSHVFQHIINTADGITAVHKNQLLHLSFHNSFQHSFPKAADIRMDHLLCKFKIPRHSIQIFAAGSHCSQQFYWCIFTHIIYFVIIHHVLTYYA